MPDRSVVYRFLGEFGSLNAGLRTAGRNVQELGTKLTATDRDGAKMRAGLDQLGKSAGRVGLVAAGGLAAVVATTAKFDSAMSAVQAATHETANNMDRLRDAAIEAGAETVYSASESAGAIEELAKAGVTTADILSGGLTGSLNLAAAGTIEVADAAELAATAMTQFRLSGDQVEHVADLLAAGAGKAQGEVSDLGMALKQSGLVASQTGLSIEETVGTLSAFASAGLLGSDAGTSFKTMLQSLTPSSVKAKEKMEELGISAYDAQGNFVGITDFAGQLQSALSTLSVEQQNAALKIIFGSDAVRAASVLYQQGAVGIQDWIDKTNDAGFAAETAGIKLDNLTGDWEQFTGALETALIGAGDGSQGPLRQLVQGGTSVVNVFNKLPQAGQNAATGLLAVTAVTGGGLWFTAKVISGVSDTRRALDDLGISAGKTGRALKALSLVGAAVSTLVALEVAAAELVKSTDKAGPSVDHLVRSLLDLNDLAGLKAINEDLGDLRHSIDLLADPGLGQKIGDVYSKVPIIGSAFADSMLPGVRGVRQEAREAASDIGALDQALATMVTQGSPEQAAAALDQLADTYGLTAGQQEQLIGLMPAYRDALDADANSADLAAGSTSGLAGATAAAGGAALTSAEATKKLQNQWKKQAEQAEEVAESFVGLGDSLNDSKVSLDDWIKQLQEQADALKNFRVNAETAAKKGLRDGLIKELSAAGPEGAMRMRQLANATKSEIDKANTAWRSQRREVNLTKEALAGVRPPDPVAIEVKTFDALTAIERLKLALSQVKSKDVAVNVHYRNIGNQLAVQAAGRSADGGTVPKTGLPYADRHPYLLADGERITSNRYGQVDKASHLLDLINAGKLTDKMVGLADGGTTGDAPTRKGMTVRGRLGDNEYELYVGKSVASATTALGQMRRIVERLNGRLESMNVNVRESERIVKRETRARDRLADRVDAQQAALDDLTGKAWGLASTIREGLSANQFESVAASGNAWDAGTGDRMATFSEIIERLNASTEDSDAFSKAAMVLGGSLSGGALESVLTQGLDTTSMFAKLSPEELAQYQATFDRNVAAKSVAGGIGGGTVYGRDMAKAEQILAASQAELVRQNEALTEANRAANQAERRRDRAEKQRDQARDDRKDIKSELADIRRELAKNRKEAESGSRSRRSK